MNERSVFLEALEQDDPGQRSEFLDTACAGDAVLRQNVDALLKSHVEAGSFLGKLGPERVAEELALQQTTDLSPGEIRALESEELAFLTATDKPDVLGRLGHYDVLEVIGRGGMGIVLRAFDAQLHRVVAIKVMAAQLAANGTARQRFTREAQAAAAVSHDHIVTIHAVEEAAAHPYLVMQFVSGMSLQERLDRSGPLHLAEIVRIGMQTAAGLASAHAQGLVHRDIKPANILLENGVERVKITDFGLARAASEASLTQSGIVAGTPQYMSPEQADGKAIDQRTDLFSLGSVLYAMCTGRAPFRASSTMAVLKRVCEETPRPIRETNPDIPAWLVGIIEKLHAKDPADRYQTAAEVAQLLGQCLAHVQQPAVVPLPSCETETKSAPHRQDAQASARKARSWAHSRSRAVVTVGVLCLLAGLLSAEATGVTDFREIVTRIFAPEDTRVHSQGTGTKGSEFKVGLVRKHRWTGQHAYYCAFSPDSRFYLATGAVGWPNSLGPNTLRVWEVATGSLVMETVGNECAVFTPDGKQVLAAGPDKQIHVWEFATGDHLRQFGMHPDWIGGLHLAPDGTKVLSGCRDGVLRLWDVASGNPISKMEEHGQSCTGCFSPDGKQILSAGSDGTVRLWDVLQAKEIRQWQYPNPKHPWIPRFAPDGQQFFEVAGDTVFCFDTGSDKVSYELRLLGQVGALGIAADGHRFLYAMKSDTTVRLLELPGGKELASFDVPSPPLGSMSFSPDGQYAAGASASGWVYLWRLPDPPVPAKK